MTGVIAEAISESPNVHGDCVGPIFEFGSPGAFAYFLMGDESTGIDHKKVKHDEFSRRHVRGLAVDPHDMSDGVEQDASTSDFLPIGCSREVGPCLVEDWQQFVDAVWASDVCGGAGR